jgi:hypothetical protein
LDAEAARMMKDSGCIHFAFGIESASDKILKSLNKKEQFWKIERSLKLVKEAGISTGGNFIFGDVEEDWQTATYTMNWWKDHQEYFIDLLYITCYPGSALYKKAVEKGKICDEAGFLEEGCPLVNISRMSDDEYRRWNYELQRYKSKHRVYTKQIKFKRKSDDSGDSFYEMEVCCPRCGETVVYGNVYKPNGYIDEFVSICRKCGKYFVVEDPDGGTQLARISEQLGSLEGEANTKKLAYFGAGVLAGKMLRNSRNSMRPVCIFDNDVKKHGESMEGIQIIPFSGDGESLREIGTIIITAPLYKDEIIAQITNHNCEEINIAVAEYKPTTGYSMFLMIR